MHRGSRLSLLVFALVMAIAAPAHADAASASADASPAPSVPDMPLADIPKLPPVDPPPASAEASQDLQTRLDQLLGTRVSDPLAELDIKFLVGDLDPAIVSAVAAHLAELREELDGAKSEALLRKVREAGRKAIRQQKKLKKGGDPDGDWLVFLLHDESREDDTWQSTVALIGMLRILEAVGTTPAVRQMVACYSYFGELARIDIDRALARMQDKAVPGLIEAKQHDARKVRSWAARQLDALHRAIPGESTSINDPDVLADVLYALGRIRDVDATGAISAFTNNDRIALRTAARAAIGALGEPASWQLKDTYKTATGESPPSEWDWKRVAQELFRIYDRARLAAVFDLWDQGKKAASEKRFGDAIAAFDSVLARSPLFEHRAEMVSAYVGQADQLLANDDKTGSLLALRKALRLGPPEGDRKKIEARIAVLEAEELIDKGTPDRFLIQRALELDPDNADAKKLLASLDEEKEARQVVQRRYFGGAIALLLGMVIAIFVLRRRDPAPAAKLAPADSDKQ